MAEANEPTGIAPTAPKQDRMAKARAAKTAKGSEIAELKAQVAALAKLVEAKAAPESAPVPEPPASRPGEYFVGGHDAATGRPVMRKRRWLRADVERLYPIVEFVPALTTPVSPHGVKPVWQLEQGKLVKVPSIVKDIHDDMIRAIERQSMYRVSDEQSRKVFAAAKNDPLKGRYFEGLKHVGYGWPIEALTAAAKGLGDDAKTMEEVGWEPEVGFPGGFGGKPLPTK